MLEEGGYYAIKGFSYQYIVSLIEIFNCKDYSHTFSFENIQDFNDDTVIYQMKYKEAQHFTNSQIKEPTIKILEQFKSIKKEYVLYAYFGDKNNGELTFSSVEELEKILLNCKIDKKQYTFTRNEKEEFIKHYKVIFSSDYASKSMELINLIKNELNVSNNVAEIYYYNLVSFIINLIIKHKPENRTCTKQDLLYYLKNNSSTIFMEFFEKNNERDKYLKFVRKEYFFEKNINDHNRVFIINLSSQNIDDYYDCISKIMMKYYVLNKRKTMVKSHAPYIHIVNLSKTQLMKLKERLFENFKFTDGYPYNGSQFNCGYITQNFLPRDNICCKMLDTLENLTSVMDSLKNKRYKSL